jgi:phospholipase C
VVLAGKRGIKVTVGVAAVLSLGVIATEPVWGAGHRKLAPARPAAAARTPIEHIVVIFDENISFDHYFGTYPTAADTDGTPFHALPGTPEINGLSERLRKHNPNRYQPARLTHEQALTCDQDHSYRQEQRAYHGGQADRFVEHTSHDTCTGQPVLYGRPGLVMDYYDGNTVTALWNYAQRYALSDNSFSTNYGPSSPGAINLISGNTHGFHVVDPFSGRTVTYGSGVASPDAHHVGTIIKDPDPAYDDCSDDNHTAKSPVGVMTGRNVGDLLNERRVTWGWFQAGFKPTTHSQRGYAVCGAQHANIGKNYVYDYSPHHNPFAYYESTANPKHKPPTSVAMIGQTDHANHNYDLSDFDDALAAGNLPAVSFLKAGVYQDGHAAYSDPLDEQEFLVGRLNALQRSPQWASTAVFIAYDDSDGWYDHVAPPRVNGSHDPVQDNAATCGKAPVANGYQNRCGYGPRLPLLAISPFARRNHVDHTVTDQTSILKFIEDNWALGRIGDSSFDEKAGSLSGMFDIAHPDPAPLILNHKTGAVVP